MKKLFSLMLVFSAILFFSACRVGDDIVSPIQYYGITTKIIVYAGLILFIIISIIVFFVYDNHKVKQRQKEARRVETEKQEKNCKEYKDCLANYISRFGVCTVDINLGNWNEYKVQNHFLVYEGSQTIVLNQREYKFIDILGYSLVDDATSETVMTSTGESKTSTGSMIGRAVVGGVLTGGLGAVAGAATAKRKTSDLGTSSTTTTHKYTVFVTVDSLANPTEKLYIENSSDKAHKIASVLNVIIERNKKQSSI